MQEIPTGKTLSENTLPRREFIRKSLIASGGLFVGMTTLGNVSLPELTTTNKPQKPSSGKKDKKPDTTIPDKPDVPPAWSNR